MKTATPASEQLLSAWYALEILTPQPLQNEEDLQASDRAKYPWMNAPEPWLRADLRPRQPNEKNVAWWIILGEIDLAKAVQRLLEVFPDEYSEEREYAKGSAAVAVLVLNAEGQLAPDKLFLASFPWAAGQVLARAFTGLTNFAPAEAELKTGLCGRLMPQTPDGKILPVTAAMLSDAFAWLRAELSLPPDIIKGEGYALRIPLKSEKTELPEPEFLNSFFLRDLQHALAAAQRNQLAPASPLARYLAAKPAQPAHDIIARPQLREEVLAPARYPPARWPGRRVPSTGQRPTLSLMQHVAVNSIARDLRDGGLFAVNGPPGTGKTTLLRDLFAHIVCTRAEALADFDTPSEAFTVIEGGEVASGPATLRLHALHPRLAGHEMVVASSNNGAVENVSGELHKAKHLADDLAEPPAYFRELAQALYPLRSDAEPGDESWGLVAGILGKSSNRKAFADLFWWHKEHGLAYPRNWPRSPAQAAPAQNHADSGETPSPTRRQPKSWADARLEFRRAITTVRRVLAILEEARLALPKLERAQQATRQAGETSDKAQTEWQRCECDAQRLRLETPRFREILSLHEASLCDHRGKRPNWWQPAWWRWLFGSAEKRRWQEDEHRIVNDVRQSRDTVASAAKSEIAAERAAHSAEAHTRTAAAALAVVRQELAALTRSLNAAGTLAGDAFAGADFWRKPEAKLQELNPWLGHAVHEKRDEAFAAALRLHEAFAHAAGAGLRHNLNILFGIIFKGKSLRDEHAEHYQSLWSTLFLLVPLVSTTFASMERMMRQTRAPVFGWLFIDEAGQSSPQCAVGALMRSRRAVVVGDPRQIPPVVTMPPLLIAAVCSAFGVDADRWAGPKGSVQTQADRATWLGTMLQTEAGDAWVGCPLRVHRRCLEPMFSVANRIAYDNLMVQAAKERLSELTRVLGDSAWIDVQGEGTSKFVPAEWEALHDILASLRQAGIVKPDVYLITPFKHVAQGVQEGIKRRHLDSWLLWDQKPRLGTVHTFQGKEASVVFLVLGAQGKDRKGARGWAAQPANLVNVAVTRAQHRLFVVGNYDEWKSMGCIPTLASALCRKRFTPTSFLTHIAERKNGRIA